MSHFFQAMKCKEPTASLEGMHGPEDIADQFFIIWRLLKLNKVQIEAVEYLASLEQKLI